MDGRSQAEAIPWVEKCSSPASRYSRPMSPPSHCRPLRILRLRFRQGSTPTPDQAARGGGEREVGCGQFLHEQSCEGGRCAIHRGLTRAPARRNAVAILPGETTKTDGDDAYCKSANENDAGCLACELFGRGMGRAPHDAYAALWGLLSSRQFGRIPTGRGTAQLRNAGRARRGGGWAMGRRVPGPAGAGPTETARPDGQAP